jgi:hypothetical protein
MSERSVRGTTGRREVVMPRRRKGPVRLVLDDVFGMHQAPLHFEYWKRRESRLGNLNSTLVTSMFRHPTFAWIDSLP